MVCTQQACLLRDSYASLQARGLQIVGVSADTSSVQNDFKSKHHLPFTLLADASGDVARAFGVPTLFGLTKRQSFLIDRGVVVWNDLRVSSSSHVQAIHAALDRLVK